MNSDEKLLFVYNADSSLFNQVGDLIHKIVKPATYQCNLCALTYSGVRMRDEWSDFIKSLPIKAEFLHRDEFVTQYPSKQNTPFPVVLMKHGDTLVEIVSTREINQTKNLDELEKLVLTTISDIKYE